MCNFNFWHLSFICIYLNSCLMPFFLCLKNFSHFYSSNLLVMWILGFYLNNFFFTCIFGILFKNSQADSSGLFFARSTLMISLHFLPICKNFDKQGFVTFKCVSLYIIGLFFFFFTTFKMFLYITNLIIWFWYAPMLFSLCLFCLTLVKPLECVDLEFNQIWNILYYCVQNCDSQPLFFLDSIIRDRIQLLFHSSLWLFLCIIFFFNLCSISIVIPSFIIILYVYFLCKF